MSKSKGTKTAAAPKAKATPSVHGQRVKTLVAGRKLRKGWR